MFVRKVMKICRAEPQNELSHVLSIGDGLSGSTAGEVGSMNGAGVLR